MWRMIALTGCLAIILLALLLAPQMPFARQCHEELVERPATALSKLRSHHLLYALILIPVMLSGAEFIAILGPEFFATYAMELAIYADAVVVSLLANAQASIKAFANRMRAALRLPLRRVGIRSKRIERTPQSQRLPANDDDERTVISGALAA